MSAPLIAIVGRLSPEATNVRGEAFAMGQRYSRAIERAGGIPVMLPPIPALLDDRLADLLGRIDGLVFHGGGDVDPRHYGEEISAEQVYGIVPEHDTCELAVIRAAIELDLPLLAICRGFQVLNVACGGTLLQDIGTDAHWHHHLPVHLEAGSRMAKALGTELAEHCHHVHHQAIDRLGDGLVVVGSAADGMPEAMEHATATWVLATQWHPEDNATDDPTQQHLFDELIRQAAAPR